MDHSQPHVGNNLYSTLDPHMTDSSTNLSKSFNSGAAVEGNGRLVRCKVSSLFDRPYERVGFRVYIDPYSPHLRLLF